MGAVLITGVDTAKLELLLKHGGILNGAVAML